MLVLPAEGALEGEVEGFEGGVVRDGEGSKDERGGGAEEGDVEEEVVGHGLEGRGRGGEGGEDGWVVVERRGREGRRLEDQARMPVPE